jgi:transcription elongation factor Elf1
MDIANLFKGQKIDFECPECDKKLKTDASNIFKRNGSMKCTGCGVTIQFENDKSIKDVKKELEKLAKMLK